METGLCFPPELTKREILPENTILSPCRFLWIFFFIKQLKKVTEDIENFHFNTAVSALMILANEMEKQDSLEIENYELFIKLLSPFAPYVTEELWQITEHKTSIHLEKWPVFDDSKTIENSFKLIVQINGKTRDFF